MTDDTSPSLPQDVLAAETGRKRVAGQIAFLTANGIPFRRNAAGRVLVSRRSWERWLAGESLQEPTTVEDTEPNWSALKAS